MNFYNEIDPFAAAWLRELIKADCIAPGVVDERSIEDIAPDELKQYTQCHFFAGIGVWSYSLRCAGWSDNRPVWTGSCPCQPFSTAGKRKGTADERHLWPAFFHLIEQCRPIVVFGEQVEAAIREGWLDLVQADMEGIGYTFRAVGIPAAGLGAPHARQRLYFVADNKHDGFSSAHGIETKPDCNEPDKRLLERDSFASGPASASQQRDNGTGQRGKGGRTEYSDCRAIVGQANNVSNGLQGRIPGRTDSEREIQHGQIGCDGPTRGFWSGADWIYCRDEKYRAVEPGTFPLAYGTTNRVGRLRGYGNAIVAPVAEAFIRSYLEG